MIRKRSCLCWKMAVIGWMTVCVAACKVERPDTVLSDEQMAAVLYDFHVAKAMGEELPGGQYYKRKLYVQSVFDKHGITEAQFDTSMAWFARYPEPLTKIYEQVTKRLKNERNIIEDLIALRDNKPKPTQPGDSVDVWAWQRIYRLTGVPLDNRLLFTRPSDANFKDRDTLVWSVRFRFPRGMADTLRAPLMAMQVSYAKDSVVSAMLRVKESGIQTIKLWADTLGSIKDVSGFIYYPPQQKSQGLVADHIMLMRYHAQDSLPPVQADTLQQTKTGDTDKKKKALSQSADTASHAKDEPSVRRGVVRPRPSGSRQGLSLKKVDEAEEKSQQKHPSNQ